MALGISRRLAGIMLALLVVSTPAVAQDAPPAATDNAEMSAIFQADQAARTNPATIDWNVVARDDSQRRARTRALLDTGSLSTGTDFWHAAFIFQHGGEPADYLMAHTLAVVAVARGRTNATWIASATLDRYLQSIGQPQIYGTQYATPDGKDTTQEPYNRTLIPDSLRNALRVPTQAEQEARRLEIQERYRSRAPQ